MEQGLVKGDYFKDSLLNSKAAFMAALLLLVSLIGYRNINISPSFL
jgi:hypothetical protein